MKKAGIILIIIGIAACALLIFSNLLSGSLTSSFSDLVDNYSTPLAFIAPLFIIAGVILRIKCGLSKKEKAYPFVMGTLISIDQGAHGYTQVNSQPVCRLTIQFTTNDGQQITTRIRTIIQLTDLAQFQPGIDIPVRYNPQNPQHIVLDFQEEANQLQNKLSQMQDQLSEADQKLDQEIAAEKQAAGQPLVVGKLLFLERTKTYFNDKEMSQYEMSQCTLTFQFTTQDGQQITATTERIIPQVTLEKEQFKLMGLSYLRYNPQSPQQITFIGSLDNIKPDEKKHADEQYQIAIGQWTQEAIDIRDKGTETKGVILKSNPTGNIVDGKSEVELQVRVTRPDNSTYEVSVTKHVPQNGMAFTVPGSIVHVFYMPDNEQHIVIGFYA
ncbi:MAG: DUF3592 domain-containing protein [Desulfuromonadales bacterium]|nr:DUF3592 domain-containing protein [Desulfuromonadales bacterium]